MFEKLIFAFFLLFLIPSVLGDIISINSGGSNEFVLIPETNIEGFYFGNIPEEIIIPSPPPTSSVTYLNITNKTEINITRGLNKTIENETIIEKIKETIKIGSNLITFLIIGIFSILILILAVFFDKCTELISKDKIIGCMILVIVALFFLVLSLFYKNISIYSLLVSIISISAIMLIIVFSIFIDKKGKV